MHTRVDIIQYFFINLQKPGILSRFVAIIETTALLPTRQNLPPSSVYRYCAEFLLHERGAASLNVRIAFLSGLRAFPQAWC